MLMNEKLVAHTNLKALHWRVGYSVAEVRKRVWIPKLRQLVKNAKFTTAMNGKGLEQ